MGSTKPPKREEESSVPLPSSLAASSAAAAGAACPSAAMAPLAVEGAEEDECLSGSHVLSREEVIRRRSRRVRQLFRIYQQQYWALMEEVRVKHRDYYWEFGLSPFDEEMENEEEHRPPVASEDDVGERRLLAHGEADIRLGFEEGKKEERKRCAYNSCKTKAMPLTRYCHAHILNDPRQVLYKPCSHVIRSCGQGAPITCGKPVLRAAVPSLCPTHSDKARKTFMQALRKAGLNVSSTSKYPKFSLFIAESVRQIQARRREASNSLANKTGQKDGKVD